MLFAIYRLDKPNAVELRLKTRPVHLDYLRSQSHRLFTAGPVLADDGKTPIGSLLLVECTNEAEARAFAAADPYDRAGLFQSLTIHPWRKVFSAPAVGGAPG
ncbi:MAG: YciI family protein [Proteobacteria bacterium]|nr:YciI family protein [Pseudomonadota bacterium]MBI3497064.1 YciI family protein [Pseudomonadota bacterium]